MIGSKGSGAEPTVVVKTIGDRLRGPVAGRSGLVVGADDGDHAVEATDEAVADQLAGEARLAIGAFVAAGLEDHAAAADGIDDPAAFVDGQGQRFFAVDILARAGGGDGHDGVPVVGDGDDDGVDVGPGEDLAIVDAGKTSSDGTILRLRRIELIDDPLGRFSAKVLGGGFVAVAGPVDIADGPDMDIRQLQKALEVVGSLVARSNHGQNNPIAGRIGAKD